MRIPIRYFSIGLLTASIVLFIMYSITDDPNQTADQLSVEQLSAALEDKGYRTISQDEFISYSVYLDEEQVDETDEKKNSTKDDSSKNDENKDKKDEKNKDEDTNKKKDSDKKDNDSDKKDNDKKDEDKDEDKKDEKEKSKSVTIEVKEGFVSEDIGKVLKEQGIIKDVDKFAKYMEDNGYSSKIQIGKFKVNSDMSSKELAEKLTTYPGS